MRMVSCTECLFADWKSSALTILEHHGLPSSGRRDVSEFTVSSPRVLQTLARRLKGMACGLRKDPLLLLLLAALGVLTAIAPGKVSTYRSRRWSIGPPSPR
jgi:hypothetical protein